MPFDIKSRAVSSSIALHKQAVEGAKLMSSGKKKLVGAILLKSKPVTIIVPTDGFVVEIMESINLERHKIDGHH